MNNLLEAKTEYTMHFIKILYPQIFNGLSSIYDDASSKSDEAKELQTYQLCLRDIPNWDSRKVKGETKRIITDSDGGELLDDILKAIIKTNIMILTSTPLEKKHDLKISYVSELDKFVHSAYIESAKEIYQYPYLFSKRYTTLEIKRNQKEARDIIQKSIETAVRKMLPMDIILKEFNGKSFTESGLSHVTDSIDNTLTEQDRHKITNLLKNDANENAMSYHLTKSQNGGNADSDKQASVNSAIDLNKALQNMPKRYTTNDKATADSESCMPNGSISVVESYTMGQSKPTNAYGALDTENRSNSSVNNRGRGTNDEYNRNKKNIDGINNY